MFCSNCGAQNPDNAAYCSSCRCALAPQAPAAPAYSRPVVPAEVPGKGLGIASMVVGIISLALFCTGWVAIICAIVGAVLGGVGMKSAKDAGMKNGMAVAGLTCSIVSLGTAAGLYFWTVVVLQETANALNEIFR